MECPVCRGRGGEWVYNYDDKEEIFDLCDRCGGTGKIDGDTEKADDVLRT